MRSLKVIVAGLALSLGVSSAVCAAETSVLVRMFDWTNEASLTPGMYTVEAYSKFYTPDAALVIDGVEVVRGLAAWVKHFERIQSTGAKVRIVTPFETEFRSGDQIYTYHVIQSIRDGTPSCLLAAGHAQLRGGKIAVLSLVRSRVDPQSPLFAAKCVWRTP